MVPAAALAPEAYLGLALVVLCAFAFASTAWTLLRGALRMGLWAASGVALSVGLTLLLRS